jgi:hexosaminidase
MPDRALAAGLRFERVEGAFTSVTGMSWAGAAAGVAPDVALPPGGPPENFGLRFTGWLEAPAAGVYTFRLNSDDGSRLAIADTMVVDHDGPHGPSERTGQVALAPGLHPIELLYFQAGGGSALRLEIDPPPGVEPDRLRWLYSPPSDELRRP